MNPDEILGAHLRTAYDDNRIRKNKRPRFFTWVRGISSIARYSALMRHDLFRAVAVLSVPLTPPFALPADISMKDVRRSLLGILYTDSGDIVEDGLHSVGWDGHFPKGETKSEQFVIPEVLPSWLTEEDLDFNVQIGY